MLASMASYRSISVSRKNVDTWARFDAAVQNLGRPSAQVLAEAVAEWLARHEDEAIEYAKRRVDMP